MSNINSYKKLFEALKLLIEAWEELGLNLKAPHEYQKLKEQKETIGKHHGWN